MAKRAMDREYVWLQCSESGDLNYRTNIRVKGGIPEKVKGGFKKYKPSTQEAHAPQDQAEVTDSIFRVPSDGTHGRR